MSVSEEQMVRSVIDEISSGIRRLNKSWTNIKKAKSEWDFQTLDQALDGFNQNVSQIAFTWNDRREIIDRDSQKMQEFVRSENYPQQVETALRNAGVPVQGNFPNYEVGPFKLVVETDEGAVKLFLGRKQEKTTVFSPERVAQWVATRYKQIAGRRFDSIRFSKELLAAYRVANQITFREESVLWGRAVPLKVIYDLLTIRQFSRQDYPISLFTYELGRMQEQFGVSLEGHRFELVTSNPSHALVIVDSQGRESRVSGLIIHKEGGNNAD